MNIHFTYCNKSMSTHTPLSISQLHKDFLSCSLVERLEVAAFARVKEGRFGAKAGT